MAKRSNAAVCKTAIRGFESHSDLIRFLPNLLVTDLIQKSFARGCWLKAVSVERLKARPKSLTLRYQKRERKIPLLLLIELYYAFIYWYRRLT